MDSLKNSSRAARPHAKVVEREPLPPKPPGADVLRMGGRRTRLLTLPEQIAEHLARDIVRQALAPGQRLKEMELALQFGASRAPIREALRLLELRGLVQIEARRGVRVSKLSAAEIDNLYEIRAALLGVAARRVASLRDAQFLAIAKAHLERMRQHANDASADRYFESTYELSSLIAEAAGNPQLSTLISSFSQQVARYTRLSLESTARRRQSLANWQRLFAAIERQDADLAEEVQTQLVHGSRDQVRRIVEQAERQKPA
jgi:DNA-binding GntR family transcriptional regulator